MLSTDLHLSLKNPCELIKFINKQLCKVNMYRYIFRNTHFNLIKSSAAIGYLETNRKIFMLVFYGNHLKTNTLLQSPVKKKINKKHEIVIIFNTFFIEIFSNLNTIVKRKHIYVILEAFLNQFKKLYKNIYTNRVPQISK